MYMQMYFQVHCWRQILMRHNNTFRMWNQLSNVLLKGIGLQCSSDVSSFKYQKDMSFLSYTDMVLIFLYTFIIFTFIMYRIFFFNFVVKIIHLHTQINTAHILFYYTYMQMDTLLCTNIFNVVYSRIDRYYSLLLFQIIIIYEC